MSDFHFVPAEAWDNPAVRKYRARQHQIERAIAKAVGKRTWPDDPKKAMEEAIKLIQAFAEATALVETEAVYELSNVRVRPKVDKAAVERGMMVAMTQAKTAPSGLDMAVLESFIQDSIHHTVRLEQTKALEQAANKIFGYKKQEYMMVPSAGACSFCLMTSAQVYRRPGHTWHKHCRCKCLPIMT